MNFADVFNVYRLFQYKASSDFKFFNLFMGIFFAIFVIAVAVRIFLVPRIRKHFIRKYYSDIFLDAFLTALIGVLLLFARKAGASFISARIFLFLLIVHFLGKIVYYVYFRIALFPKFMSIYHAEQKRLQYLPKKGQKKKKK